MFLILLVVYSAWICPLEFAFLRYLPSTLFLVDTVVNGFFAVDIILTFFVAFLDRKSYLLVDDPKRIAITSVFNYSDSIQSLFVLYDPHEIYPFFSNVGIYPHGSSSICARWLHFDT